MQPRHQLLGQHGPELQQAGLQIAQGIAEQGRIALPLGFAQQRGQHGGIEQAALQLIGHGIGEQHQTAEHATERGEIPAGETRQGCAVANADRLQHLAAIGVEVEAADRGPYLRAEIGELLPAVEIAGGEGGQDRPGGGIETQDPVGDGLIKAGEPVVELITSRQQAGGGGAGGRVGEQRRQAIEQVDGADQIAEIELELSALHQVDQIEQGAGHRRQGRRASDAVADAAEAEAILRRQPERQQRHSRIAQGRQQLAADARDGPAAQGLGRLAAGHPLAQQRFELGDAIKDAAEHAGITAGLQQVVVAPEQQPRPQGLAAGAHPEGRVSGVALLAVAEQQAEQQPQILDAIGGGEPAEQIAQIEAEAVVAASSAATAAAAAGVGPAGVESAATGQTPLQVEVGPHEAGGGIAG